MQIVIDIDETIFKRARYEYYGENEVNHSLVNEILISVMNGTILPKEHGRLKDEDEIVKAIEDRVEFLRKNDALFMRLRKDIDILGCIPKIRCEVQTIVEADKEN